MWHQSMRIHHPTLAIVKSPFPSAPPSSRGNWRNFVQCLLWGGYIEFEIELRNDALC